MFDRRQEHLENLEEIQLFLKHLQREKRLKIIEMCSYIQKQWRERQRKMEEMERIRLNNLLKNDKINMETVGH